VPPPGDHACGRRGLAAKESVVVVAGDAAVAGAVLGGAHTWQAACVNIVPPLVPPVAVPQFRVFDVSSSGIRFALKEDVGIYHAAMASNDRPPRNTFVDSELAALGPGTLHDHVTGQPIDVTFEAVSCSLAEAMRLLQA
jgi:hypothetical protein